jgi:hypothetical protein
MYKPSTSDLSDLQAYIDGPNMGLRPFLGVEASVWGNLNNPKDGARDLAALRTRQMDDPFTELVMTKLVRPFFRIVGHRFMKKDPVLGVYADGECKDETTREVGRVVTTFLASAMLVGSINALYFITSMVARMGVIWAFNIIFALCLLIFAKGKPIEVFSATAAWVIHISLLGSCSFLIASPPSRLFSFREILALARPRLSQS